MHARVRMQRGACACAHTSRVRRRAPPAMAAVAAGLHTAGEHATARRIHHTVVRGAMAGAGAGASDSENISQASLRVNSPSSLVIYSTAVCSPATLRLRQGCEAPAPCLAPHPSRARGLRCRQASGRTRQRPCDTTGLSAFRCRTCGHGGTAPQERTRGCTGSPCSLPSIAQRRHPCRTSQIFPDFCWLDLVSAGACQLPSKRGSGNIPLPVYAHGEEGRGTAHR